MRGAIADSGESGGFSRNVSRNRKRVGTMSQLPKRTMRFLVILLLAVVGAGSLLIGAVYLGFQIGFYQHRYVECDPEVLLSDLEKVFAFEFPSDVREVKAAKTSTTDRIIALFMVKFAAQPAAIDEFLASFPKEPLEVMLEPYDIESDGRSRHTFPTPRWFLKPIQQGKRGFCHRGFGRIVIYIDTTDKKCSVVYMDGQVSSDMMPGFSPMRDGKAAELQSVGNSDK